MPNSEVIFRAASQKQAADIARELQWLQHPATVVRVRSTVIVQCPLTTLPKVVAQMNEVCAPSVDVHTEPYGGAISDEAVVFGLMQVQTGKNVHVSRPLTSKAQSLLNELVEHGYYLKDEKGYLQRSDAPSLPVVAQKRRLDILAEDYIVQLYAGEVCHAH